MKFRGATVFISLLSVLAVGGFFPDQAFGQMIRNSGSERMIDRQRMGCGLWLPDHTSTRPVSHIHQPNRMSVLPYDYYSPYQQQSPLFRVFNNGDFSTQKSGVIECNKFDKRGTLRYPDSKHAIAIIH